MATVLIVDDDADIRWSIRQVLEDDGHEVIEAADGAEGLAQLQSAPQALVVLLDLMMPKLNGAGLLHHVAKDWALSTRNSYIVMTADNLYVPLAISGIMARLNIPVVTKPFDIRYMQELVKRRDEQLQLNLLEARTAM